MHFTHPHGRAAPAWQGPTILLYTWSWGVLKLTQLFTGASSFLLRIPSGHILLKNLLVFDTTWLSSTVRWRQQGLLARLYMSGCMKRERRERSVAHKRLKMKFEIHQHTSVLPYCEHAVLSISKTASEAIEDAASCRRCAVYWRTSIYFLQWALSLSFLTCKMKKLEYMVAKIWSTPKFLWLYVTSTNNRFLILNHSLWNTVIYLDPCILPDLHKFIIMRLSWLLTQNNSLAHGSGKLVFSWNDNIQFAATIADPTFKTKHQCWLLKWLFYF